MSDEHLHGHFYRCGDCSETYDDKGTEHRCEGSRDDVLALLETEREKVERLREALSIAASVVGPHPINAMTRAPTVAQMQALQAALRTAGAFE